MNDSSRRSLESFIAQQALADRVSITEVKRLSGGSIQENWLIRADIDGGSHAGPLQAVVRTDSPSRVAVSRSRAEEFALLRVAFAAGVTVPEPLWLCEDQALIGRQFFVMRRVSGTAAGHLLVKDSRHGGDRVQLTQRLGAELAHIHSIRPPCVDLRFLPELAQTPALDAIERLRHHLDSQTTPRPTLEWGLRWLERHAPPRDSIVLCHRDFRTGSCLAWAAHLRHPILVAQHRPTSSASQPIFVQRRTR